MSFRTYFEVSGADASNLGGQVARQHVRVSQRLHDVDRVVAIVSGKGGVGKSYVTSAVALALAARGLALGVVDADLQSPTIARLLGAHGPLSVGDDGVAPAIGSRGIRVMSMDLLLADGAPLRWTSAAGEAHTWRGVAETGALREFLADVRWGALDVLLVDMPPDAQRLEDLAALVPALAGAVAVTLPTEESRRSVARAIRATQDAGVQLLGVVENMSGYACDECGVTRPLFPGDAAAALTAEFGLPLLAHFPFSPFGHVPVGEAAAVADAVLAARAKPLAVADAAHA